MFNRGYAISDKNYDKAQKAYDRDMRANHPELVDDKGNSTYRNPIITRADGTKYFNPAIDNENRNSDYNVWFDDKNADGTTTRRPSWQMFPEYTYDKSREQFDYITEALNGLTTTGFTKMDEMYKNAMDAIG